MFKFSLSVRALRRMVLGLAFATAGASASGFPDHALTLIVPSVPGGAGDTVARVLAEDMSRILGQSIVVENRAGAGGIVGAKSVAHAAPDGYTLLFAFDSTLAVSPYLLSKPPYDSEKSFAPIGQVGAVQYTLVAAPDQGIRSVNDLIQQAKAKPNSIPYASGGVGSIHQLIMEVFQGKAGITLQHVPYKAAPQGFNDLMGNHVSVMFIANGPGLAAASAGKVVALGTAGSQTAPGVPRLGDLVPGFEFESWFGLFAPEGVPADRLQTLSLALKQALATPAVQSKMDVAGVVPQWSDGKAMGERLHRDIGSYRTILKEKGISLD